MSHSKAALEEPLLQGSPSPEVTVRPHLFLGMTFETAIRFLKLIGIIKPDAKEQSALARGALIFSRGKYEGAGTVRQRLGDDWEKWIGELQNYPDELTGYDLNCAIRKWLKEQGAEDKSVCEVLMEKGWVGIGRAEAFLSHVQSEHPMITLRAMARASRGTYAREAEYIWVDYFSLHQCQKNSFEPEEVVALVGKIGNTVVSMDMQRTYTSRTFCILESYASVKAGSQISVVDMNPASAFKCPCGMRIMAVDSMNAKCRHEDSKQKIDHWIERDVGFEKLDAAIEREITVGLQHYACMFWCIACTCPCCVWCGWCKCLEKNGCVPNDCATATKRGCAQLLCCSWPLSCGHTPARK